MSQVLKDIEFTRHERMRLRRAREEGPNQYEAVLSAIHQDRTTLETLKSFSLPRAAGPDPQPQACN